MASWETTGIEVPIKGLAVEKHSWGNRGTECSFYYKSYPVLALVEQRNGRDTRFAYVVKADDIGRTRVEYPDEKVRVTPDIHNSALPDGGGGLTIVVEAAARENDPLDPPAVTRWKADVQTKVEEMYETYWNSPEGKAHRAKFED